MIIRQCYMELNGQNFFFNLRTKLTTPEDKDGFPAS